LASFPYPSKKGEKGQIPDAWETRSARKGVEKHNFLGKKPGDEQWNAGGFSSLLVVRGGGGREPGGGEKG